MHHKAGAGDSIFSTLYFKLHFESDFLPWTQNPGMGIMECAMGLC